MTVTSAMTESCSTFLRPNPGPWWSGDRREDWQSAGSRGRGRRGLTGELPHRPQRGFPLPRFPASPLSHQEGQVVVLCVESLGEIVEAFLGLGTRRTGGNFAGSR